MANANLAIVLVLISAFMHAGWNTVVKAGADRFLSLAVVDSTALILCLAGLPLVSLPPRAVWIYISISVAFNTAYRLFLIRAYETADFGQAYPIVRGVPPVLVALFSAVLLDEHLTLYGFLGVILVSAGIISLTFVRGMTLEMIAPISMAALAGLFVAAYTIVDAKGVRESDTALQFIIYLTIFQSIPIPLLAIMKDRSGFAPHIKKHWMAGSIGGVFYITAYGIVLYAFSIISAAKVSAIRETSVVIAAIIAAVFFREGFGAKRIVSAMVILSGIILIKLST